MEDVGVVCGWVFRESDLREGCWRAGGSLCSFSSMVVPVLAAIIVKNPSGSERIGSGGTIVSPGTGGMRRIRDGIVRGSEECSGESHLGRITFPGNGLR